MKLKISKLKLNSKGKLKRICRHWVKITYSVLIKTLKYFRAPGPDGNQTHNFF